MDGPLTPTALGPNPATYNHSNDMLNLTAIVLSSLLLNLPLQSGQAPGEDPAAGSAPPALSMAEQLFGVVSDPLLIPEAEQLLTLNDLLLAYSNLTGTVFLQSERTRQLTRSTSLSLDFGIEVPSEDVHGFVHAIMSANQLCFSVTPAHSPRVIRVRRLEGSSGATILSTAIVVPSESLSDLVELNAIMVTTVVDLPHCDVRMLSNSIRTMISDANTQRVLPASGSNAIVLCGSPGIVANMAQTLKLAEDSARAAEQGRALTVRRVVLAHAVAAEVVDAVSAFHGEEEGSQPRWYVVADQRTNAVVISARKGSMAGLEALVKLFDQKAE